MAAFANRTAHLVRGRWLADQTRHLDFEMKDAPRFGYVAGQWLSMKATTAEGEEVTRAYSIASPPNGGNHFSLCLNRVQDGWMSNHLCDMKEGDEITCQGPFGDFILRPPMHDTLFIATGTGIAPIRSMLHWLLDRSQDGRTGMSLDPRHQNRKLWLIFGNRTESGLHYHDEFLQLAQDHENFQYMPTLSRAEDSWKGWRGYVQDHVPEIVRGRTDMHAYVCGLDKMVKANRELLKSLGWDRKSIRYEKYD